MSRLQRHIQNGAVFADSLSDLRSLEQEWDLTVVGAPTIAPAPTGGGKSIKLDGSAGYLLRTVDQGQNDSLGSITGWIKLSAVGPGQDIYATCDSATADHYWAFGLHTDGRLRVVANESLFDRVRGNTVLAVDTWYHVALVSNGAIWVIYLNGVAEALTVMNGSNNGNWFADVILRDNFSIGAMVRSTVVDFWNGQIADLTVWDRALSATEIDQLYKGTAYDYMLNLVSAWELDTNDTTVGAIQDIGYKGNGNHGTVIGNPVVVDGPAGGKALDMDGTGDYLGCGTGLGTLLGDGVTKLSVSVWLKNDVVASPNDGIWAFGLFLSAHGAINFARASNVFMLRIAGTATLTAADPEGEWLHVVLTFDGVTGKMIINGVVEDSDSVALSIDLDALEFRWGAYFSASFPYEGLMAKGKVFDAGLTDLQARDLYERERRGAA